MASDRNREALRYALLGLGGVALLRSVGTGAADDGDDTNDPPDDGGGTGPETKDVELIVISTRTGGDHYTLQVNGEPSKVMDGSTNKAEDSDRISHVDEDNGIWEINGMTGPASGSDPYGDTFTYTATVPPTAGIEGFSAQSLSEMTIQANGQELDVHALPEPEDYGPKLPGGPIGGGGGYENLHTSGDYTVSSLSELESALSSAGRGDVVFVDGVIDTGNRDGIYVPSGVTLASGRGADGAGTGVINCNDRSADPLIELHGRLEGIEISGPIPDVVKYVGDQDVDYPIGIGVAPMDNSEIANCHLHHFGKIIDQPFTSGVRIHHNEVSYSAVEGLGYGIDADSSGERTVIEFNYMHTCRHEVAGHGGDGYIVRNNIFDREKISYWSSSLAQQRVDDHNCCGSHEVYNNTFRMTGEMFSFRDGVASDATCHHNWFYDTDPIGLEDFPDGNVYNNHYGSDEPSSNIGHPR